MNLFCAGLRKTLKPRPQLTGSQWADQYRIVAPGTSPEPGPWRTDRVPYLREPMDAATAHDVEKVVIMAASQVAKSELLINVMGYFIDQEPSSIMMVQPTVEAAESFSKERIDPTFQATPALRSKMAVPSDPEKGRSRKTSSTIRMKHFTGGYVAMVGSNSPSGLASRPIRVLLCDEIDRFGQTQEGDPLKLAIQRTTNFANRKIVLVSTPTTELRAGGPTVWSEFMASDQREYEVECPHCHKRFTLSWDNVKWDKDESGAIIDTSIRMECPHCRAKVRGGDRPDPYLLASGVWVPKNPGSETRGYHLTSLCSPWVRLRDLVHEWHDANGARDKAGMQEFINLKLGQPWREEAEDADLWEKISARREFYPEGGVLPDEVLMLTCGVDVQHDRLEASVFGWGAGYESWGVCHKIIYGSPKEPQAWSALDALLMSVFPSKDGRELRIGCTLVDSGDGTCVEDVYRYTRQRERARVFSCKGSSVAGKPVIDRPSRNNALHAALFVLGTDGAKRLIFQRLAIRDIGSGFIHFPLSRDSGFTDDYFQQLTAERFVRRFNAGRMTERWEKIRERNEALDCCVYATAAAELMRPTLEALVKEPQPQLQASPAPRPRRRVFSKGISL